MGLSESGAADHRAEKIILAELTAAQWPEAGGRIRLRAP
jgi:hypothetical protein